MKKITLILSSCALFMSLPASAVIVAGANGSGANHTTRDQLESELNTCFPAYENVIRYSDASGVYIGYDPATRDVTVITARHITTNATAGATVDIDGLTYERQADGADGFGQLIGGDLRLVRYRREDLEVPSLPIIRLATSDPLPRSSLIMIGYGQGRMEAAATDPSVTDALDIMVEEFAYPGYNGSGISEKRWGTNNVQQLGPNGETTYQFSIGGVTSTGFFTNFTKPESDQWLTSHEAQATVGDSGGGAFFYDDHEWVLGGIISGQSLLYQQAGNTSVFGNATIFTNLADYPLEIPSALRSTGSTSSIPEPSVWLLVLGGSFCLLIRRRAEKIA